MTENRSGNEVHVSGVAYRVDAGVPHILLCRRSDSRQLFPGRWEGCGGRIHPGLSMPASVREHFQEELRMWVDPMPVTTPYFSKDAGVAMSGVRFICSTRDRPILKADRHSESRWISISNILGGVEGINQSNCTPDLLHQVLRLFHANSLVN